MFNLRSLDLNLLTVFEAIYEFGTVGAAADRLALSQSATSHALSRLREACKDDLFVRAGQGLLSLRNELHEHADEGSAVHRDGSFHLIIHGRIGLPAAAARTDKKH